MGHIYSTALKFRRHNYGYIAAMLYANWKKYVRQKTRHTQTKELGMK